MGRIFPKKLSHCEFFKHRWSEPKNVDKIFRYDFHDSLWLTVRKHIRRSMKRHRIGMDFGAGDGRLSIDIAGFFYKFIFLDQSKEAIKCIISNYEQRYHKSPEAYQIDLYKFKTQKVNIADYDELTNNVDLIILSHVIHYLPKLELEELLAEIKDLLKGGGRCYLVCESNIEKILPPNPMGYKHFDFELEVNHSAEDLKALINDFGFLLLENHISEEKPFEISIPRAFFDKHMRKPLGFANNSVNSYTNSYIRKFDLLEFYFEKK